MKTTLYDGAVELSRGSNHVYRAKVDGGKSQIAPNVTSVTDKMDKSRALLIWQQRTVEQAIRETFPIGTNFRMDAAQMEKVTHAISHSSDVVKNSAAAIGTMVHQYAESKLRGENPARPVDPQAKAAAHAFDVWLKINKVEVIEVERAVYSRKHGYAGTCDLLAKVNGRLTLIDLKTSKSVYDSHFLQLEGYASALEEELGIEIEDRAILRLDKETADLEFHVLPDTRERDLETFLALLTVYRFQSAARKDVAALRAAA
tara:strand:+ start:67 stop:843 length:777 start_codon:yes stop_codon:yes gene_type:complete